MEQPAQRCAPAGRRAGPELVGKPSRDSKPTATWAQICWVTPTPVPLRMGDALAYVTIVGSASLRACDARRLAQSERAVQAGNAIHELDRLGPQIQWDHLGPPGNVEELVTRLLYGHGADVVMETALKHRGLEEVRSARDHLAVVLCEHVAPALGVLGLQVERLSIDRIEDDSRWDHEA